MAENTLSAGFKMTWEKWVIAVIVASCASYFVGDYRGASRADASCELRWAQRDQADAVGALQNQADETAKANEWADKKAEIEKDAQTEKKRLETDLAGARAERDGLRRAFIAANDRYISERKSKNPGAVTGIAPGGASGNMPADVFSSVADRTTELARLADERRDKGLRCERQYDAVK